MKTYSLKNKDTGEVVKMTLDEIIKNINRDRSEEWTCYNKKDWREGLSEFTEFTLIETKKGKK